MAQGKVTITGATGYLGSAILVDLLKSGYTAHIVVRSQAKAKRLQEAPVLANLNKASACKYFIVPDLAVPGALDEAAAGTAFIIHCGTPLPFGDQQDDFIQPTIDCTLSALESARRISTVKRVIIMSSVAAFINPDIVGGDYEPPKEIFIDDTPNEEFGPPYVNPLLAYCAAKTAAFRRSVEWMEKAGRDGIDFDLINLAPAYCFGQHPLATNLSELMATSNQLLLQVIAADGVKRLQGQQPARSVSVGILLDDVVKAVNKSLDLVAVRTPVSGSSKGISSYVMALRIEWNDVYPIVRRNWPEEVKKGLLAGEGDWPSKANVNWNLGKFHEIFGFELRGLEDMLDDLVPQYLELLEQDKANGKAL
ncbi:NAD(P)-binding protein [Cryphonectria parasitica EP155]|uniref:NAD(P)-binding protein n=1 Tax=Cryphonectria parasitica (strain ATCC 38755 / EP155) TaxID=660469 RepID=A0A9P5CR49_CRYP1|nr:NAD(P)-binding protein [Cryphonectria parasitica EP155]KAF3767883.1 NAD(P)-binding protein [Cryphonectria parasitica EP155]